MTGKILVTKSGKRKQYRSPEAILRRNDQERARQKEMNEAFDALRKVIPNGEWKGKKKSKCDTLQGAIEHIENLLELLASPEVPSSYDQIYPNSYSSPTSSLDQSGYSYGSSGYYSPNGSFQDQNCFQQIPQSTSPECQSFSQFYPDLSSFPFTGIPFLPTEEDNPLPPLASSSSARYCPY
ncbi:Oidioi.mRNA.OKI2018_I69.chr2.g8333.t1.cds [Oikopleura dioica]|uniref:Oidioi.mRNA.OKI2018_I69.chr2.g8333.t1.cds n=1 Tax=Oikopleura dioica TaxID=34765 RepID=A0ABN7TC66_OIKDI|nr:Oidioi.mRNA.OKI2018_I69.chr2.g8333.t1.cds [Oikopleura dioica]